MSEPPVFDDEDKKLIRYFADRYRKHEDHLSYDDFCEYLGLERYLCARVRERMMMLGAVAEGEHFALIILPACVELVHAWEHPPLRDRWDEATKWFRSKAWSLPVLVIAVGLPALKGWVDVVKMLLEWMGITHGGK